MNEDTTYLTGRPYQEVVDDLLTALIGGVVNEPIPYDLKADLYRLAEPASDVRAVTGQLGGDRHSFLKDVDFAFSGADNAVVWGAGDRPDDETTFYVDYARKNSRSPLSDINVGSVSRTLAEAIGREITTVYKQIDLAYLSGFLDTATGRSLDLVVAILGVTRKTSEFAVGLATFFRDPAVAGAIVIPEGTVLATAKGEVRFETTEQRVLQAGQARIDAPVRAADGFAGEQGIVAAGAISAMILPLAGIARVTNFDPTLRAAADETDDELRARARAALRALGKATLAALDRVIREERATPLEFWDPNSPPAQASDPGTVAILVDAEPTRFASLRGAVEETRAAGVVTTLVAHYVYFRPRLAAQVIPGLTAAGKEKVKGEVIAAFQGYVDGLGSGEAALGPKLLDALKAVTEVSHPVFKDVLASKSDVGQPQGDAPSAAPTGARIPSRDQVQPLAGAGSGRGSDADVEAGQFQVSAQVGGEAWWVVLDMSSADVLLEEGS
jgi:hypothetical protein